MTRIRVSHSLTNGSSDEHILSKCVSHVGYFNYTSSKTWAKIHTQPIRMKLNKFLAPKKGGGGLFVRRGGRGEFTVCLSFSISIFSKIMSCNKSLVLLPNPVQDHNGWISALVLLLMDLAVQYLYCQDLTWGLVSIKTPSRRKK